jgi:hypothetical protein
MAGRGSGILSEGKTITLQVGNIKIDVLFNHR